MSSGTRIGCLTLVILSAGGAVSLTLALLAASRQDLAGVTIGLALCIVFYLCVVVTAYRMGMHRRVDSH